MASKLELMLEAEKRGILPDDKKVLLDEARKRGLVGQKPSEAITNAKGAWEGVKEGSTFGFGDELQAGVAAYSSAPFVEGLTLGDAYDQSLQELRQEKEQQQGAAPLSSLAGNIAGAIATGKGLTSLSKAVAPQTTAKVAQYAAANPIKSTGAIGGASGAAYGFGSGEGGIENRLENAATYGALGAGLGLAAPAAIKYAPIAAKNTSKGVSNIIQGAKAASQDEIDNVARGMSGEASQLYTKFRDTGAALHNMTAQNIFGKMEQAVSSAGKTNPKLHGDTLSVLQDVKDTIAAGKPVGLEDLDQLRQLLNDSIRKNTDVAGKLNPDALRSVKAKNALDDAVKKLNKADIVGGKKESVDLLLSARSKWAQKERYENVSRVLQKAGGDPNKIKTGLTRFLSDPRKTKGFSKEEMSALKYAANSTTPEKILKGLGRFGVDPGNVFLPVVTGGLGTLAGGGIGAGALVGTGTVARQASKYAARGKADALLKAIEAGR